VKTFHGRLYPVDLKPPSPIRDWSGWPEDVQPILRAWNRKGGAHRLSFKGWRVFKCPDCEAFCAPQPNGTCVLDGEDICDYCIIERARRNDSVILG
jgi:hypothetical protein